MKSIIDETVLQSVPEKAKEFTTLILTLQKVFEELNSSRQSLHATKSTQHRHTIDSSRYNTTCSEKQTKQCQTEQEVASISPFSTVNTAETSSDKIHTSPFIINQEGVLETIKEMAKYEKDFKKLEKSLKETTEKYNDQLKPFRASFSQLDTLFEIKELDSEKDIQKVFEKVEIHEKQQLLQSPQRPQSLQNLTEGAASLGEPSPRMTEDLRGSPPNKKLAMLEKEKAQLKEKMEALASTIVSSV